MPQRIPHKEKKVGRKDKTRTFRVPPYNTQLAETNGQTEKEKRQVDHRLTRETDKKAPEEQTVRDFSFKEANTLDHTYVYYLYFHIGGDR